jgi:putative ABC transport system permease protein
LRRTLVVAQFIIAIGLMAVTLVVLKQVRFAERKDLGFDRNGLVVLRNETARERKNALLIKNEILRGTSAVSAASLAWLPSSQSRSISGFKVEGRTEDKAVTAQTLSFDADFVSTMGLRLVAGQNFEAGRPAEADGVLINETAVKAFKLQNPVGSRLMRENRFVRVLGVLKDWHTNSIHSEIYPVVVFPADDSAAELVVRLPRDRVESALGEIRAVWARLLPGQTFDLEFVDDVLIQSYREEQRLAVLLVSFCALTVFVACLGIFGLASFSAEQRTKEIGVRKVLGASVLGLTVLLSRSFARWVLLANVVAWPAAYFAVRGWLEGFAYRTPIGPGPFLLAGSLAVLIAFASVVYQTTKAALANPIDSLHYE